jgi:antitoxin component of RelBE/YafQ-DinJ toxin-antitoxin module
MKDVGLRIRIDRDLREQFVVACKAADKPASQVIREFMREYVALYEANASGSKPETKNKR